MIRGQAGDDVLAGSSGKDRLQAKQARPAFSGDPGLPAVVAGAINRIAASPNSAAEIVSKGGRMGLRRGPGLDVAARADLPRDLGSVSVTGLLDPPSSRKEVSFSGLTAAASPGQMLSFPTQIRVFNTATGELRYEIRPGLRIRPLPLPPIHVREGQYVID